MSNPVESFVGEIRILPTCMPLPEGWLQCNGAMVSISQYTQLYAVIGTTYGGDGRSVFALPNLVGTLAVGQGRGLGLSAYALGDKFGANQVALTDATYPSHNHTMSATTQPATTNAPVNALFAAGQPAANAIFYTDGKETPTFVPLNGQSITYSGLGVPHANTAPTIAITHIICWLGILPLRP